MDAGDVRGVEEHIANGTARFMSAWSARWHELLDGAVEHLRGEDVAPDAASLLESLRGTPLVLKYMAAAKHDAFLRRDVVAFQSTQATWGTATYVTPLLEPFSSIHYGRAGCAMKLDVAQIGRVFDARTAPGQSHFLTFARSHVLYRHSLLSVHGSTTLTAIKDDFAHAFQLDLSVFPPDESGRGYTSPGDDWLAVYPGRGAAPILGGLARVNGRLNDQRLVAIAEEEFTRPPRRTTREPAFGFTSYSSSDKRPLAHGMLLAYAMHGHLGVVA